MPSETVPPIIDDVLCTGCGECVEQCPESALALRDGKAWLARPDECSYCAGCQNVCPPGAITLPYLVVFGE